MVQSVDFWQDWEQYLLSINWLWFPISRSAQILPTSPTTKSSFFLALSQKTNRHLEEERKLKQDKIKTNVETEKQRAKGKSPPEAHTEIKAHVGTHKSPKITRSETIKYISKRPAGERGERGRGEKQKRRGRRGEEKRRRSRGGEGAGGGRKRRKKRSRGEETSPDKVLWDQKKKKYHWVHFDLDIYCRTWGQLLKVVRIPIFHHF